LPRAPFCGAAKINPLGATKEKPVKFLILFVAWCILLALSWPAALLVVVLVPLVWLLSLPFRLLGLCISAAFALLKGFYLRDFSVIGLSRAHSVRPRAA
jgi:hypothetical protein